MRGIDDFDRRLAAWFEATATPSAPAGELESVLDATRRRRPRPGWLARPGSDWVGSRAARLEDRVQPGLNRQLLLAALAVLAAAAIVGAAWVGAQILRQRQSPFPNSPGNGWIVFSASEDPHPAASADQDVYVIGDEDIYVVGESRAPRRIVGTDADNLDQICPAFSADATRLAYGQGHRTSATDFNAYTEAALVIATVDRDGNVTDARTIPVGGTVPPPCPVWSPDGQRIAFAIPGNDSVGVTQAAGAGDVRVVTVGSGQVTIRPGVWASDLDWAPDGKLLAMATGDRPETRPRAGGPLLLYSVATGAVTRLPGASDVTSLAWSPDGRRIAYERIRTRATLSADGGEFAGTEKFETWTTSVDGVGGNLQTAPFEENHGIGPVWSPTGDQIVYQRICAVHPITLSSPCREQHEVVLLTPGTVPDGTRPAGTELVLPVVRADAAAGPAAWFPYEVTWSPDGHELLYGAWSEPIPWGASFDTLSGLIEVDPTGASPPVLLHEADTGAVSWASVPQP